MSRVGNYLKEIDWSAKFKLFNGHDIIAGQSNLVTRRDSSFRKTLQITKFRILEYGQLAVQNDQKTAGAEKLNTTYH